MAVVRSVSNLSRNGVSDWVIQRISAVIMALYVLFLLGFLLCCQPIEYYQWQGFFSHTAVRIFSILFLLSLMLHAWVGIWTISTDYIKCVFMRGLVQILVILSLLSCFIWGVVILWQ